MLDNAGRDKTGHVLARQTRVLCAGVKWIYLSNDSRNERIDFGGNHIPRRWCRWLLAYR